MKHLRAFLLGMIEVRSDITTNFDGDGTDEGADLQDTYERGRMFAARFVRRELVP